MGLYTFISNEVFGINECFYIQPVALFITNKCIMKNIIEWFRI